MTLTFCLLFSTVKRGLKNSKKCMFATSCLSDSLYHVHKLLDCALRSVVFRIFISFAL